MTEITTGVDAVTLALRSFELMASGTREEFEALIDPRFVNHEAKDEPPESRQEHGPAAAYATALWLRDAFADLRWEVHDVVAEGDLVVVHCTMSGRHVRPFAGYDEHAEVKEVFPPTGRRFAPRRRTGSGSRTGSWSSTGPTATTSAWPSSSAGCRPACGYLLRMALAKRRLRRQRPSAS